MPLNFALSAQDAERLRAPLAPPAPRPRDAITFARPPPASGPHDPEVLAVATGCALLTNVSLVKVTALLNKNAEAKKRIMAVYYDRDIPNDAKAAYLKRTLRQHGADAPESYGAASSSS